MSDAIGSLGTLDLNGTVFIDNTASFVGGAISSKHKRD